MTALRSTTAAAVALAVARRLIPVAIDHAPERLVRTNVRGARVPAVLGGPLAAGALAGLVTTSPRRGRNDQRVARAAAGLVIVTGLAGLFDDAGGDEAARGFIGHVRALTSGTITGGTVKMAAGALGGMGAARATGLPPLEAVSAVALTANLVNLLDRAPGRAAKASLLAAVPLLLVGARRFRPACAALAGALLACAPADLGEEAMLGDAGANPVGAVLGLGLALTLEGTPRRAVIASLAAANAASERWSFSEVIERVGWLHAWDRWGRLSVARASNPVTPC